MVSGRGTIAYLASGRPTVIAPDGSGSARSRSDPRAGQRAGLSHDGKLLAYSAADGV